MQGLSSKLIIPVFILLLSVSFGLFVHQYRLTHMALLQSERNHREAILEFARNTATLEESIAQLSASTTLLDAELFEARKENFHLLSRLALFESDNTLLQDQLVSAQHLLGLYDKVSKTDRELLQKYSKVYFLNENYIPGSLATITPEYLFAKEKPLFIHANVAGYLDRLLDAATSTGTPLVVLSAYRSFGTQAQLKSTYVTTYGSGANKFSAEQGYSEHQLGTTVDLATPLLGVADLRFEKTPAYLWLTQHAHKYGFVLSYPKLNAYYQFEPWHWRFVGVFLATKLHDEGKYFYDMDQREIDTYLVNIFDPIPVGS